MNPLRVLSTLAHFKFAITFWHSKTNSKVCAYVVDENSVTKNLYEIKILIIIKSIQQLLAQENKITPQRMWPFPSIEK